MALPDWRTSSAGTRVRAALWLLDTVGVGNAFRKADLRAAFPGVEQIDRRVRDLRDDGWTIATYREDRSLEQDELRFVSMGGRVWEPGYRRTSAAVSAKQRAAVFAADDYTCILCGVIGGEAYHDDPLRVARLTCQRLPGAVGDPVRLRTVCDRCHTGGDPGESLADVLAAVRRLPDEDRKVVATWLARGQRVSRPADLVWARLQRLPAQDRAAAADELGV